VIDRRAFVTGVGAMLALPTVSAGQPAKVPHVGVLASSTEGNFAPSVKAFRGNSRSGWLGRRSQSSVLASKYIRLAEMAAELVKLKVDVIAALGTPATEAVKQATTTVPIVMESLSDVVSTGLVSNLTRPGGNVTGVSGFAPSLSGKRLQLIREILPTTRRVGVLANRSNAATEPVIRATEAAAQQMRLPLSVVDVHQPTELSAAS
jgi:putative ABC transport system substrate-binding protein